jgi:hypothetical protein
MVYRLMVLGGASAAPANNTYVARIVERTDAAGGRFCEVVNERRFVSSGDAKAAAAASGGEYEAVGLTPWQPAFSVPAITGLRIAAEFRDPAQKENETPMIRIFEVVRPIGQMGQ